MHSDIDVVGVDYGCGWGERRTPWDQVGVNGEHTGTTQG